MNNIQRLQVKKYISDLLTIHDAEAVFITALPDIRWASGFSGSNGLLLVKPDAVHFITDGRYREQAQDEVKGATIHVPGYALMANLAESGLLEDVTSVAFQADQVTVAELESWKPHFPNVTWQPVENMLTRQVASKSADEIQRIRAAQAITDAVFEHLLGFIQPGQREVEVAAEIVYQHLQRGAARMSFDPIVAGGAHGALPHKRPTDRVLRQGDMVVLDFGCVLHGYASDMTRTIALGEPGEQARAVYSVVLAAQERAIDAVQAGLSTQALDGMARDAITAAGYGDYFNHGLGHGIGLQTHEWPRISYHVDDELPEGAVVTIEPGIYLPEQFGVRIEDMVVVRANGCENLTASPKSLIVL
ncbi:MAG TPA: aminopeptidase P family protein [Rhodothermales bacterium]|nr:aminopeptidase P family protein [Rhodothermales bacterium]